MLEIVVWYRHKNVAGLNRNSLTTKKKTTTYDIEYRSLVQTQKCGGIKPVDEILDLPSW